MNISIYCSSITGNTRKLAVYVAEKLRSAGHEALLWDSSDLVRKDQGDEEEPDISILAFWCRRSGLDDYSADLLSRWKGRKIVGIGTIGGNVRGAYGDRVRENVKKAIGQENICLGVSICQGSVDLKRIERRRHLPKESKHYVSPEKYRRVLKTQGHPDQEDLKRVADYVSRVLGIYIPAQNGYTVDDWIYSEKD